MGEMVWKGNIWRNETGYLNEMPNDVSLSFVIGKKKCCYQSKIWQSGSLNPRGTEASYNMTNCQMLYGCGIFTRRKILACLKCVKVARSEEYFVQIKNTNRNKALFLFISSMHMYQCFSLCMHFQVWVSS